MSSNGVGGGVGGVDVVINYTTAATVAIMARDNRRHARKSDGVPLKICSVDLVHQFFLPENDCDCGEDRSFSSQDHHAAVLQITCAWDAPERNSRETKIAR